VEDAGAFTLAEVIDAQNTTPTEGNVPDSGESPPSRPPWPHPGASPPPFRRWPPWRRRSRRLGKAKKSFLDILVQYAQIVGPVLILGTLIFGVYQFNKNQEQSNKQQEINAAQLLDQQRQTTLNQYFDDMSALVLQNSLTKSRLGDPVRAIAVARTDTAVRDLDGARKGRLIRYLWEANLITEPQPIVTLYQVNLNGADFKGANLAQADLSTNNLIGANFANANPNGANLSGANLYHANLSDANLSCFKSSGGSSAGILKPGGVVNVVCTHSADPSLRADLRAADLVGADLIGADLIGADLIGADLRGADLRGATYNSKPMSLTDQRGNTLTVGPTLWPQGFNPTAAEATCFDC